MATVLFIFTLTIVIAGVAFASLYIWLNTFSGIRDLRERNSAALKMINATIITSFAFAFGYCIISDADSIETAIERTSLLFSIISIAWLVVLVLCGIAVMYLFLSKKMFKDEAVAGLRKVLTRSLIGAVLGIVLSWLLS